MGRPGDLLMRGVDGAPSFPYYWKYGTQQAVTALEALAQNHASHLPIARSSGPRDARRLIAERMDLPAPTLSFHLSQLKHAGLAACRRDGRR